MVYYNLSTWKFEWFIRSCSFFHPVTTWGIFSNDGFFSPLKMYWIYFRHLFTDSYDIFYYSALIALLEELFSLPNLKYLDALIFLRETLHPSKFVRLTGRKDDRRVIEHVFKFFDWVNAWIWSNGNQKMEKAILLLIRKTGKKGGNTHEKYS